MLLQLMLLQLGLKLMLMMMLPHAGADAAKAGVGGAEEAGAVAPCWGLRGPLLPMAAAAYAVAAEVSVA